MDIIELVDTLLAHLKSPRPETEWIELKENNADPDDIGEYISAISNAAALHGKHTGVIFWGVRDSDHTIVGTTFEPRRCKVGNEELESWLSHHLTPRINFKIHEFNFGGKELVAVEVPAAFHTPVRFKETEFIRVGTYKKKLREYSEKERDLWAILSSASFENGLARRYLTKSDVVELLDVQSYFELTKQRFPENQDAVLARLVAEALARPEPGSRFAITNLGAILFAKDLSSFELLARKAVRVIVYKGNNKVEAIREQVGQRGYAAGFEGLIGYVNQLLPANESIGQALRTDVRMYPELAIRELVANAIVHQDFTQHGTGPMVEIFADRIEVTNPGEPLIETSRFIDAPPQSRNDRLASFMRRLNICEERGSGIDKVVFQVELFQLPAPDFRVANKHTQAVLFSQQPFAKMSRSDRIRACYQHACLQYVSNQRLSNATLRKRFSFTDSNYPMASRIISDTIGAGLIKPYESGTASRKHAQYVPFWA